jgi:hypothetical protein
LIRLLLRGAGIVMMSALVGAQGGAVVTLDGSAVDPLQRGSHRATLLLFVCTDCPVSNRYAPEIRRLAERFTSRGVRVWLVYPDRADSAGDIRTHLVEYDLPAIALRDPDHVLIKRARATVTPEAAVFDAEGVLRYHGRIDDRYRSVGISRPFPTERTLENAVTAVLEGRSVARPYAPAVGCIVADMTAADPLTTR